MATQIYFGQFDKIRYGVSSNLDATRRSFFTLLQDPSLPNSSNESNERIPYVYEKTGSTRTCTHTHTHTHTHVVAPQNELPSGGEHHHFSMGTLSEGKHDMDIKMEKSDGKTRQTMMRQYHKSIPGRHMHAMEFERYEKSSGYQASWATIFCLIFQPITARKMELNRCRVFQDIIFQRFSWGKTY